MSIIYITEDEGKNILDIVCKIDFFVLSSRYEKTTTIMIKHNMYFSMERNSRPPSIASLLIAEAPSIRSYSMIVIHKLKFGPVQFVPHKFRHPLNSIYRNTQIGITLWKHAAFA